MIARGRGETAFVADTYRPDIFDDNDRQFWLALHGYVKSCSSEIGVNEVFPFVEGILERPDGFYGGGGLHYMFWFQNAEELRAFWVECARLEVLHYKKVSGCTSQALASLAADVPTSSDSGDSG
jgi:hypothetical protein